MDTDHVQLRRQMDHLAGTTIREAVPTLHCDVGMVGLMLCLRDGRFLALETDSELRLSIKQPTSRLDLLPGIEGWLAKAELQQRAAEGEPR